MFCIVLSAAIKPNNGMLQCTGTMHMHAGNDLGEEGALALEEALKENATLQWVDLSGMLSEGGIVISHKMRMVRGQK